MDLSINFIFFLLFKIDTQIYTQKINFIFILNCLFRNLQEIKKTENSNTQKTENSNPNSNFWALDL